MKMVGECLFIVINHFLVVASAFEKAKPNISAAAYVLPLTRTVQQVCEDLIFIDLFQASFVLFIFVYFIIFSAIPARKNRGLLGGSHTV